MSLKRGHPSASAVGRKAWLVLWAALAVACGGGGGGTAAEVSAPPAGPPAVPAPPAAGVYLEASATTTQLRPSWVAAVGTAPTPAPWVAWEALADGDTRLLLGSADVTAPGDLQYFDAASAQSGQADLRSSAADRLRGTVTGLSQALSLDGTAQPDPRLLSLAELSGRSWQGHWRHHGPTAQTRGEALNRTLSFAPAAGSRQVFSNQTILNCYVDAELSEQQAGKPGLFRLALTLAQIPGQASCSHAGSYQGLAVALRAAGGGTAQLRLAAVDTPTRRAISYAAQ